MLQNKTESILLHSPSLVEEVGVLSGEAAGGGGGDGGRPLLRGDDVAEDVVGVNCCRG